jgi:hypothetical protein
VDSVTVRIEFSQPLDPTTPIDSTNLRVVALPDSTPVAVRELLTQRQFDSLQTVARQQADSAAEARRDTTGAPQRVRPGPPAPPPPPPPPPPAPPADRQAVRPSGRPPVDTLLVRQLLARRRIPTDKLVLKLVSPMKPETRYVVLVQGATNLIGRKGEGNVSFTVPKPTPRDTTRRRP